HAGNVVAIPDRFQQRIGETEIQQVLHRLLAEVVVDAENVVFAEKTVQRAIERARGFQVATERLFDDHARALRAAGSRESLHHRHEHAGRNREVMQRMLGIAKRSAQLRIGLRVVVIAVDVLHLLRQLRERDLVHAAVFLEAVPGTLAQLVDIPARTRDANHRHVQLAVLDQRLQCRKNLFVSEVARGTEKYEGIGLGRCHQLGSLCRMTRTWWVVPSSMSGTPAPESCNVTPSNSIAATPRQTWPGFSTSIRQAVPPCRYVATKPFHLRGIQGSMRNRSPSTRKPSTHSTIARYSQPAEPEYQVQPPRPACGATE